MLSGEVEERSRVIVREGERVRNSEGRKRGHEIIDKDERMKIDRKRKMIERKKKIDFVERMRKDREWL